MLSKLKWFLVAMALAVPAGVLAIPGSIFTLNDWGLPTAPDFPAKTVVLTFDDGPSSNTPQILKILAQKHVPATFFVVGEEALQYPLLGREYNEGHEIGNHTYSHPDLSKSSDWRLQMELSLTRLLIEDQTGHSTRLFRPPFQGSDNLAPQSQDLIASVDRMGYVTAGEDIDSEDWKRPGPGKIIANSTQDSNGGVILLHDGGGDRSQTVEALPNIIEYYQQRGYKFTTIGGALGLSRGQIMPSPSRGDRLLSKLAAIVFGGYSLARRTLFWVITLLIAASFGRMALVILAALMQSRRRPPADPPHAYACSVIVPAYNEAAVIQSCLRSILASDYPRFEVLVVDDGSKDGTAELAEAFHDPRLRVIRKANGGKASALNYGIQLARAGIVVAIDADTVFQPDTLSRLARHFRNPAVGAVSGNTRIANRHTLITRLQSLEYIVGFNLDRRMGDLFDCITVVPGAIGAFRKSVLLQTSGFTYDTLAEDTDLTLSIKEAGHRIVYDADAVAYTEAPSTIKDLLKQRFRWTFGTMQAVWKHKYAIFNRRYGTLGLVGLPYLLFYQILFPLVSPLFDLAVVFGLLNHQYNLIFISSGVYLAADVVMSGIALKLDGERLYHLWLIIPQRVIYRQLMYYVIIRSAVNVLKGRLVGWGTLKRSGKHLKNVSA